MKSAALLLSGLLFASVTATALASEAAPASTKPDLAKGQAKSTEVCGACHTADGSRGSPANPILQGQHPDYIVKQLQDFKSGARTNDAGTMSSVSKTLSAQDMDDLAHFIANLN